MDVEVHRITIGRVEVMDFEPADPTNFGESGTVYLGAKGELGSDGFYFFACTPEWLLERFEDPLSDESKRFWDEDEFSDERSPLMYYLPSPEPMTMFGTGLFLMRAWSRDTLIRSIHAVCRRESGSEWPAIASRIGRLLPWESDYEWDRRHS